MEIILGNNPEQILIGAIRIMALAVFICVNIAYLFAIDSPNSVTVMVTNVATAIGALVNFALWTNYSITDMGAMIAIIFAAVGMALVANETYKYHDDKRNHTALRNPAVGIWLLMALVSSWFIASA